ncbi:MAG TPA: sugar ABC transporter substrate-binding protein [Candidatus Paceibacterota bacterium]|nr:sugar ABC transporter substrate-binding protein [Candidatus Paceibacterota bacterium]
MIRNSHLRALALGAAISFLAISAVSPSFAAKSKAVKPVTITLSSWQFVEPGRGEALSDLIDTFNESHKKIQVKVVSVPYPTYANTILTQLGARSGPDVVNLDYDVFVQAQQAGLLADITKLIKKPAGGLAVYDAKFLVGKKRFGVPWETLGYALIVNKDLLDKANVAVPTTFAEFVAAAKKLTNGTDQYGFAFRNTMTQETGWWYDLSNWVYGFGGSWTDANGNPTVNSAAVIKAVTEYKNFFDQKYIPQGAEAATYRQMFWEGKVAMEIDNGSVPTIFSTQNPAIKKNLVIIKNPFPFPTNAQILEGTSINAASKNKEAAAVFINWLLQTAQQRQLMNALGHPGVAAVVTPPKALIFDKPWVVPYQAVGRYGKLILPQRAELKTAEIRHAVLAQMDLVLRSGLSPTDAMNAAQTEVKSILHK